MTERAGVLHVRIVTGAGGGPEKTILRSPRFLEGTRYRALVAYLHPPHDPGFRVLEERAAAQRCPLVSIPESLPIDPRVLAKLARLCREHDVRIWHGHDYKSNLYGVLLRRAAKVKLVTTVHGWVKHTSRTPLYYAIDRWTLKRHDHVVAVSADLFERCREIGVEASRLTLIENAIDTDEYRREKPRGAGGGRLRVGAVGRLSDEKGFDLLIRAVDRLIGEGFDLELEIAGEGDQRDALLAAIRAARAPERMRLAGYVEDARALFERMDLFCLSSLREGLPNVVLEAMAMEVPVLATRSGGMEAFARDGEDALLCAPGSVDALADGLRRLATDAALRERLARNARARVVETHGFRRRMERMVAVYDAVLGGGAAR